MPRRKGKFALLYRSIDLLLEHPSRVLEVLLALLLGYLAVGSVAHFAGILSYGGWLPVFFAGLVPALALFLAIVWLRKEPLPVYWQMFLPLPFLLWACYSLSFGNGSPWMGAQQLGYYWALYLIFIFAVVGLRNRSSWYVIFWIIQAGWLWAITTAFLQFYFRNDWLPLAALESGVVWDGRASGVIGDPNLFAVGMLFMFIGNLYLTLIKRHSGYLRIFCGFLALTAVLAIVVSGDRTLLWMLLALLTLVPFLTVESWNLKLKRWLWLVLALFSFTGVLWFTADLYTVQPRLADLWQGAPLPERAISERMGLNMFFAAPVTGQGIGALPDYGEAFRDEISTTRREWRAAPSYIKIASELGAVGLLLAIVPMFILWAQGWLSWRAVPYSHGNKDADFRNKPLKEEVAMNGSTGQEANEAPSVQPVSVRRRRRRKQKRLSVKRSLPLTGEKIIRGAGWLAVTVAFFTFWRFPLLSVPWLMTPLLFACAFLIRFSFDPLQLKSKSMLTRTVWTLALLLPSTLILFAGRPQVQSQADLHAAQFLFTSANQLRAQNPGQEPLSQAVQLLDAILQNTPRHAPAFALLARAQVAEYRLDGIVTDTDHGTTVQMARRATELDPRLWQSWLALGEALSYRSQVFSQDADQAFARALELAPYRREVLLAYARFLERNPQRRDEALAYVQRVLSVDPNDAEAERLRARLALR